MKFAAKLSCLFQLFVSACDRVLTQDWLQRDRDSAGRPQYVSSGLKMSSCDDLVKLDKLNMKVCNFIPAQFRYPSILCSENEHIRKESVVFHQGCD